ncbi:hypothetical protein DXG01_002372, partial [Tephrocybe rancida]
MGEPEPLGQDAPQPPLGLTARSTPPPALPPPANLTTGEPGPLDLIVNNVPPAMSLPEGDAPPSALGPNRPQRERKAPKRFQDFVPHMAMPLLNLHAPVVDGPIPALQAVEATAPTDARLDIVPTGTAPQVQVFESCRNIFGLSRTYFSTRPPSHDPDDHSTLSDLLDGVLDTSETSSLVPLLKQPSYHPYPNLNSFLLGNWYWNHGCQKSQEDFKALLKIVGSPSFKPQDLQSTPWNAINATLGSNDFDDEDRRGEWEDEDAGWRATKVTLDVPFHQRMKDPGIHAKVIGDLYHRSIISVLKEKLANTVDVTHLHYEPYELNWRPSPEAEKVRVHGELFTSPALVDAHRELQASPPEPGCTLPRCIIGLMIWSDATHLTSFGSSKLWPAYLYIGNESKYRRSKPSLHLANHIAYFQTLPDSFKDFASEHVAGKGGPTPAFLAHCRRELFHTQWAILLDEEFLDAWIHGIVIMCLDGILRRFYPRIITYSADYPEKALLASIRNGGRLPCPRCLVPKVHLHRMGMKSDMRQRVKAIRIRDHARKEDANTVRQKIYEDLYAVNSKVVEQILMPESLVSSS